MTTLTVVPAEPLLPPWSCLDLGVAGVSDAVALRPLVSVPLVPGFTPLHVVTTAFTPPAVFLDLVIVSVLAPLLHQDTVDVLDPAPLLIPTCGTLHHHLLRGIALLLRIRILIVALEALDSLALDDHEGEEEDAGEHVASEDGGEALPH